jgi:uncharacterized membrane protein
MMNDTVSHSQEPREFRAVLRPHRSLGPTGFLVLMGVISAISFVTGAAFYFMGAWPVVGFFGLDVFIIYIAFRLNYRAGRLHETVELSLSDLTITRFHPSGRKERFVLNPYWVRVRLAEGRDGRTDLRLHLHGKELSFGRFLTDDERRDFAKVLTGALIEVRGGVRI